MRTVHDAAGGRAGLLALARAWHARCLADPVASHPFGHGGCTASTSSGWQPTGVRRSAVPRLTRTPWETRPAC